MPQLSCYKKMSSEVCTELHVHQNNLNFKLTLPGDSSLERPLNRNIEILLGWRVALDTLPLINAF